MPPESGLWDGDLLDAALATVRDRPAGGPPALARDPHVFLLEYRDGLRAAVCMLNGVLHDRAFAANITRVAQPAGSEAEVVATCWAHHSQEPLGQAAYLLEQA